MGTLATKRNVLLLSLLLALLTSFLVYRFLQEQKRRSAIVKVPVVVAEKEIRAREIIKPGEVSVRYVDGSQVKGSVCRSEDEVVGRVALVKLAPNTLISPTDVGEPTIKLGLSYEIPPYMRAVTVGINDESGVAGFLKPRDHVDVIGAFEVDGKAIARTVLQDIELLAIGTEVEQDKVKKDAGKARTTNRKTTATLLVTPKDAEKLVLAGNQGKIVLALRSPGDLVKTTTPGTNSVQLTGIVPKRVAEEREKERVAAAPQAAQPARPASRIWDQTPVRPGEWGKQPSPAPLFAASPIEEPKREIQVIRGNRVETVEVEDSKTTKEVSGNGPDGLLAH